MEGQSADDLKRMHRELGAYLSARDLSQLVIKSLETENIEDENGIPFQIFFGISGNTHRFWNIANARRIVGYAPEDDSQLRFANEIAEVIQKRGERQEVRGKRGEGWSSPVLPLTSHLFGRCPVLHLYASTSFE